MLLDVLTINLWGLPWPFARDRVPRKRRFREHMLHANYHLVGIQELWWPWRRKLDLETLILPRSRRDCGLALSGRLANHGESRVRHFTEHRGLDRLKRKGVLSTRVLLERGRHLAVHVTHLQAGREGAEIRARQVDELLEYVSSDAAPAILMGDFNFYADRGEDRCSCDKLRAHGFTDVGDAAEAKSTYSGSNPYARRRHCDERFDRIFVRSGAGVHLETVNAAVLSDIAAPLSDHHPLHARLHVKV